MVDTYGRKISALVICFGEAASVLLFGFTQTFKWALFSRIIMGATLTFRVPTISIIAHLCDDTNQNSALTYFASLRSFGMILGQVVGGIKSIIQCILRLNKLSFKDFVKKNYLQTQFFHSLELYPSDPETPKIFVNLYYNSVGYSVCGACMHTHVSNKSTHRLAQATVFFLYRPYKFSSGILSINIQIR